MNDELDITEISTKEFYLSLDRKHGKISSYYDDYGNLWVLFVGDDDPYNINVINFIANEEEE